MNIQVHATEYSIKSIEGFDHLREEVVKALNNDSKVSIVICEPYSETKKRLIDRMSEILLGMEEYHSKKCTEFEKKHIINYINKVHGSYINAKFFKELFEKFDLKY